MTTLSVLEFNSADGADQALRILQRLQQQQLIKMVDAAVVTWPQDSKGPKTRQLVSTARAGALGGAFWGLLIGLILFVPLLGLAVGAATGAVTGALKDFGIDDNFIKQIRDKVKPGTSALFLMTAHAVVDRVVAELKSLNPELITSNLSDEQESRLRELFAEGQMTTA
ncbi:MAG TPA: DUF1269 domain-containing protein [Blastocatellia bacterium]|jgi:uncharacterized membrane protein|nr:DUF1269 domain-containing protein [Blastocatellia bacterium]